MEKIYSFKKEILFKTNIYDILSIAIDKKFSIDGYSIKGKFKVNGEYLITEQEKDSFDIDIPYLNYIEDNYDVSNIKVDIDDFYYEIKDSNKLVINIDIKVDNLEERCIDKEEPINDEYDIEVDNSINEITNNIDEKEIIKIDPWENEFGRSPFTVLTSFKDKLAYAVAEYCGDNYRMKSYIEAENTFDTIFKPLLIHLIGCDEIEWDKWDNTHFVVYSNDKAEYFDEFEEVPYEKLIHVDKSERNNFSDDDITYGGYRNIDKDSRHIEDAWFNVPDFGSIDHQSSGLLKRFLKNNNLSLEDYLVRKDVVVVIDGDEYGELDNLINCGLIKKDSIILRFPKSEPFDSYRYNLLDILKIWEGGLAIYGGIIGGIIYIFYYR